MEQPTTMPVPRRVTILSALGLFLVIAAIFSGVARCDFIFYDDPAIFDEPWITGGLTLHNVGVVFSTFQHCLWVPLTWVSFMADVSLFGLNPGAMHLMNVAWHAGAAVLLFFALRRLTGRHWPSLIVAALFGVHPINVESVAWVVERKNVLCGFFFMLALFFWSDWAVERKRRGWWLALGSFALALMAKPMAVTFPCLLLLLDVWPLRRLTLANGIRVTLEKIPFFIGSAVVSVVASQAGKAHSYTLEELALDARITNALCSYGAYLRDLVWPSGLALTHGHPLVAQWLPATGALGVLLALLALALWQRRARPYLLIGLLAFLGMLVPNLGLVQIGPQARADRFAYFAEIGLFIAVVWGIDSLLPSIRAMRIAVTAVPLAALSATSILQVKAWEDSFTLFSHCARVTNGDVLALEHLAYACDRMGDPKSAAMLLDRVAMFHRTHATLWDKTGEFYAKSGNFAEAARACGNAVKLEPKNPAYRGNLARTLAGLGKNEEAEAEFKASIAIDSRIASVHHHYGLLLDRLGRKEEARAQSEEARRALNVKAVRHGETTDEARGG